MAILAIFILDLNCVYIVSSNGIGIRTGAGKIFTFKSEVDFGCSIRKLFTVFNDFLVADEQDGTITVGGTYSCW